MKKPAVIDFETHAIESWPNYPPKPVGVSIMLPGKKPKYYAWGHPDENNCTFDDARRALETVYSGGYRILCHNGKFDFCVAQVHMGFAVPSWENLEDTMFLAFLADPHSPNLKLKDLAANLLDMPPDEQDAIRDWCIEHKLLTRTAKEAGHLIAQCPGSLVGKYANGDVLRTLKLWELLYPQIIERGMGPAYDRERKLLPILLKNELQGVRVDLKLMQADDAIYEKAGATVDSWLRKQLKVGQDFNLDSDVQLAERLISCKKADSDLFLLTPTGKQSTAKDSLNGAITDKKLLQVLQYRTRLATAYGTFLHPWMLEATGCGGIIHPSWNQTRSGSGNNMSGTRTGRLSASRFMNLPKAFLEKETGKGAYTHPVHIKDLPQLPFMRKYMLPFEGETWCKRDYAAQELRVLAHFGDGELQAQFNLNPMLDVHTYAANMITEKLGKTVTRKQTKTVGFGLLYGLGLGGLAEQLNVNVGQAKTIKEAYFNIFPELNDIQRTLKEYEMTGQPLTTIGGRQYYCEAPKYSEKYGREQTFGYKMMNYLIQASSADISKQALINYDQIKSQGKMTVFVHDEINLSVPKKYIKSEMRLLKEAMMDVPTDVPMLSDGAIGLNWGALEKYND